MKRLCVIDVNIPHYNDVCEVIVWEPGDPFPSLGPSVGVDTETELFTDTKADPPIVVLGVFDPTNKTCWIVYWTDVAAFIKELSLRNIEQRYFNLGFDEQVLDNEDDEHTLLTAIDNGRVRDMQVRVHCHEIAELGYIRGNLYSLAGCSLHFLKIKLDKGDPNDLEHSARMTFKRYNDDGSVYRITEEQARYLPYDCITTWCLGEHISPQPTEIQHTKGMVVLAHISANGFQVDPVVFNALEAKLFKARDGYRQELLAYGFPDPYANAKDDAHEQLEFMYAQANILSNKIGYTFIPPLTVDPDVTVNGISYCRPSKDQLRTLIATSVLLEEDPNTVLKLCKIVSNIMRDTKVKTPKALKDIYDAVVEEHSLGAFDACKRQIVLTAFIGHFIEALNTQFEIAKISGFNISSAIESTASYLDEHPDWFSAEPSIGPRKFFQEHAKTVLEQNPDLELETTPKSGDIKLTLKDRWRLEDCDIKDGFLDSYINFNHCQKYLSTYLNREMVKSDCRVHPKFTNILRTGRTSATAPLTPIL